MSKSVKKSLPTPPSFVRTLVPVAVGQIVAYIATLGIVVPGDVETALTVILGFIATTIWYVAVRFLEQKFPKVGILLGWAATPDGYTSAKEKREVVGEVVGRVVLDDDAKH